MGKIILSLLVGALAPQCVTIAEARTAVAPIPGFACMSLNMTQAQTMDPSFVVPLHSDPTSVSPAVGRASAIVIVRSPEIVKNGFVSAMLFNGRVGWIEASQVKPWRNPSGNRQQCVPSRMSDGSIGFAFR
jgi:hypothetical protein